MKFLAAATTLILLQCTAVPTNAQNTVPVPAPNNTSPASNNTSPASNTTNPGDPVVITMNCTQAFMPLEADTGNNATSNASSAINITEAGCKAFETPDGAYCRAEYCHGLPTCLNCNLLIPGATPNDTTISNVTTPSVACASNYFLPDLNDTNRQALCTDAQAQSYSCTGACTGYATCELCIAMDDPALQDGTAPNATTSGAPNATTGGAPPAASPSPDAKGPAAVPPPPPAPQVTPQA